ncbi:MAG TPA: hypothetical protein VFP89_08115 [Propionibacteriaceae bacterium]|nr:hypothetical protein [Propionibacteriaceae bacterium]
MTERQPKAVRIIVGVLLMASFVLISIALVVRYAGAWGVPYFSFTTDRGSRCTNNFTGYTCSPVTLADIEFYGEVDLPADTKVINSLYRSTHDFALDASLQVPKRSAAAALKGLTTAYGSCRGGRPSPLPTAGVTGACVFTNDDAVTGASQVSSQLFLVGTGVRKDGVRLVSLSVKSR